MDLLDGWMRDEFAGCVRECHEISLMDLLRVSILDPSFSLPPSS